MSRRLGLLSVFGALSLACVTPPPPQAPPSPKSISVAVVAQNPDGIGIPGAIVGIGDQRGRGNADGYHFFEYVPVCQSDPCRPNVHVEAKGFLPYDGLYQIFPGMPDFQVRLTPAAPPAAPSIPRRHGLVRLNGRGLQDDDGPYLGLCASFFWGGWGFEHDRDRLAANLEWLARRGVDCIRVMAVIGWPKREFGPQFSAAWDASMAGLTDLAFDRFGLRIEWTLLADANVAASPSARSDAAHRLAAMVRARPQKIHALEVTNEGPATGWGGSEGEARRLATILEAETQNIIMVTSPGEASPAGVALWYEGSLSASRAVVPFHLPRSPGAEGLWRPVRQVRDPVLATSLAWANDEPIGIGSTVAADDDPLRLTMAAALTWLASGAWYTIHTGAGVGGGASWDLARGRAANVWEQPALEAGLKGIAAVRSVLPRDLSTWVFGNNNRTFPHYPFDVEPIMPLIPDGRLLRAFGSVSGNRFVVMPLVAKVPVPFTPVRSAHVDVIDPMTGRITGRHDGAFSWQGDAAIMLGTFR